MPCVLFLGGNGHCPARLEPARQALRERSWAPFTLVDARLPGFDGRPPAADLEGMLEALDQELAGADPALVYATGVTGLLLLALRARGRHLERPVVLQAPVLAGLRRRWLPRLMRFAPVRRLVAALLQLAPVQALLVRRLFRRPPAPALQAAFFRGYARCPAFGRLFRDLDPAWIDALLAELRARPPALEGVTVWWGLQDAVMGLAELELTEAELGHRFPRRRFPSWGHYPMIDEPEAWVAAVAEELRGEPADSLG